MMTVVVAVLGKMMRSDREPLREREESRLCGLETESVYCALKLWRMRTFAVFLAELTESVALIDDCDLEVDVGHVRVVNIRVKSHAGRLSAAKVKHVEGSGEAGV